MVSILSVMIGNAGYTEETLDGNDQCKVTKLLNLIHGHS